MKEITLGQGERYGKKLVFCESEEEAALLKQIVEEERVIERLAILRTLTLLRDEHSATRGEAKGIDGAMHCVRARGI